MFASVLPTSLTSSKYGAKTPTKFSVRVFKAPALPIPPATLNAKMDLGYRSPTEQQAQTWFSSRSQPPKAPHALPHLNVNVGYDSSRPRSTITQYSIYPLVANATTFIYEQSTCSKSCSSDCDSTTMTSSPARSIDSTMALKSPVDSEQFERRLDERIPTPAPRRDSFIIWDRNHPPAPTQNPHFAPSESDADELDRIAQVNAHYNAAPTGSYYATSNDPSRDEDTRLASALQVMDIRGSQPRNAVPQPTYSNSFVNHSPEEMHPSLGVQYAGSGAPAPPSFFPDSDVDRRVSHEPLYQQSNSSSSTEAPLPSPVIWDSDSTQNRDRSPTVQRQTGAQVPSPTYQHAGHQHPVSRPAGSRDYPSPDSNNSRHSDRRQTADELPPSAQPPALVRQRSLFADHRNSVAIPWSDNNTSQPTYETRDRVEFPQVSDSRRHEEYRRDVRYDSSPTVPSPAESGSRMYPQTASESRRHEEPAIRQYEEPVTRRSTDQGRANPGHSHRDSAFLRERVLSTSYNGVPQNRSPPRRSSGESRRDSHTAANDVPEGQPSTSRRKDPRPLDLVPVSMDARNSPTSQSPTARRRSSVVFAAAGPRSEPSPTDMHGVSGHERSGDRQRTRTNSISHQRPVDLQSPTSLPPSPDRPDPNAHHDQSRRPRHPDLAGARDSVYFNVHEPPREAEPRPRHSSRLSFSYPPPSPSQPTPTRSQPETSHMNMPSHADPHASRGRTPFPVPRVSAPEPHRRLSDGDRPSTDVPVYPRSATPYERSSGSSRNTVITVPSAYHQTSRAHGEHPRRFSDGDQSIHPRLLSSGRNSTPLGRSVRWTDELICPSPIIASQRRKGWFNRRGDQLWTNDGQYRPANQGDEYPPHLDDYPEPGQGWMNEEGTRIDLGHRLIPKAPLRSALKQTRG